jgi:hypothetical protein
MWDVNFQYRAAICHSQSSESVRKGMQKSPHWSQHVPYLQVYQTGDFQLCPQITTFPIFMCAHIHVHTWIINHGNKEANNATGDRNRRHFYICFITLHEYPSHYFSVQEFIIGSTALVIHLQLREVNED